MSRLSLILCGLLAGCTLPRVTPSAPLYAERAWAGAIWIPAHADFEEYTAAKSLADACEQVTGVRPEVREESDDAALAGPGILLGRTRSATQAGVVAPEGDGDSAVRRTIGKNLYVVGNSPLATRLAVGRLCEQALEMTFTMPGDDGADFIPLTQVAWPVDETWRPAFAWRSVAGLEDAESIEWSRRVGFGSHPACTHGLHAAFDLNLFANRPELFPLVRGERQSPVLAGRSAQPNLAHPDAAVLTAAYAKRWFATHPEALAVPLGINDSVVYDEGPEAAGNGLYDGRPYRTNYVFGFLNRVAALDWNSGGEHAIGCLAYLDAAGPPSVRLAPTIFPVVCADRIQYANARFAAADAAALAAWGRTGVKRFGTWDYAFGRDVAIPRSHIGALARSIRAAHTAGVCLWFAELEPLWAFDACKAWVAAKLLDRPDLSADALADQWAQAAYGPAAPAMRSLQRRVEQVWTEIAERRAAGQWLLGWRDGCAADELLTPSLEQGAAHALKEADEAFSTAPHDARHNRMRARLAQFKLAWQASVAEAHRSRLAKAIGSGNDNRMRSARQLWQDMLELEMARDRTQRALNHELWAGSQPVSWSAFIQPNPWPLLAARLSPAESRALVLPTDAPAAARIALAVVRRANELTTKLVTKGVPDKGWTQWLAAPSSRSDSTGYLAWVAPQGRIFRRVEVASGEMLRVSINAESALGFAEGMTTLTLRFPDGPKPPAQKPLHAPAPPLVSAALPYTIRVWGHSVLEVPVSESAGKVAEVEIAFIDKLTPIRDVTIERLAPRR